MYEMLEVPDERLLKFIPNYTLNLIVPDEITDFEQLTTEVGCVLEFLNTKNNLGKTKELLTTKRDRFSHLDWESAKLLNKCANLNLGILENGSNVEGGFDMCKTFEDYGAEREAEGRTEGRETGKQEMSLNIYKAMPEVSIAKIAEMVETTVDIVTGWILGAGLPLR